MRLREELERKRFEEERQMHERLRLEE
jgi:hypothetical protein